LVAYFFMDHPVCSAVHKFLLHVGVRVHVAPAGEAKKVVTEAEVPATVAATEPAAKSTVKPAEPAVAAAAVAATEAAAPAPTSAAEEKKETAEKVSEKKPEEESSEEESSEEESSSEEEESEEEKVEAEKPKTAEVKMEKRVEDKVVVEEKGCIRYLYTSFLGGIAWSVRLSVTLYVCCHPAKTVGRNEMPFSRDTHMVPSNIILDSRPGKGDLGVGTPSSQRCRPSPNNFGLC